MQRDGADSVYEEQRSVIRDLVTAVYAGGADALEPWLRPSWMLATSADERLRVVVDQVASLTDTSVRAWHTRLCL